ncbi:MAG: metal-sulfur cluster assembly factor [Candidatus Micrarchaeota archaeon]|nr:metal-sulfur cluster assembly factor [Candidatus Micrarchaeota archaeon]
MAGVGREDVINALRSVKDPELSISVVDLGLIYGVEVKGGKVEVVMTLTTPMCPLGPVIIDDVRKAVEGIPGVKAVDVKVVFDPPWTPDRMSPEYREKLGLGL